MTNAKTPSELFIDAVLEEKIRAAVRRMIEAGWDREEIVDEFTGIIDEETGEEG